MTFSELASEFYARGFDYLNQDAAGRIRAKRWLNEAYLEDICADEPWDFLRATASGTAPLTVSDVDTIEAVWNDTQDYVLSETTAGDVELAGVDISTAGTAAYWYFTSATTIAVYPTNTMDTLRVRYFKIPTELSADGDTPLLPARWHSLIVDAAVVRAYWDTDNPEMGQALEQRFLNRKAKMLAAEHVRSVEPLSISSYAEDW